MSPLILVLKKLAHRIVHLKFWGIIGMTSFHLSRQHLEISLQLNAETLFFLPTFSPFSLDISVYVSLSRTLSLKILQIVDDKSLSPSPFLSKFPFVQFSKSPFLPHPHVSFLFFCFYNDGVMKNLKKGVKYYYQVIFLY